MLINLSLEDTHLAWFSLICFCTLATSDCSSSNLTNRAEVSFSLRWMTLSSTFLVRSKSRTISWVTLRSPSTLRRSFSVWARVLFSRLKELSSSSNVCSSLALMLLRWSTFSWAVSRSSLALAEFSPTCFFSLFSLLITSS